MPFLVVVEDFASNVNAEDYGFDVVSALNAAKDKSLVHNIDFVVVLNNGVPVVKFEDGEEVSI